MRPSQKNNRSRGRGNRKGGGGGGGNNMNRVYDSAGPEGKVRGTPQQIIDKYVSLARDAQTSGDRVASENFLQHAEHYQRIVIQATAAQEQARREAQEAATDQRGGGNGEDRGGRQQGGQDAQPGEAKAKPEAAAPAAEIGGMAMIDAAPASEPLIVEGEGAGAPKAPSNGDGRRRRRKPEQSDAAPAQPAPDQPEAQPEG